MLAITDAGTLVHMTFDPAATQILLQPIAHAEKRITDIEFLVDKQFAAAITASGDILIVDIVQKQLAFQMTLPGQVSSLECLSVKQLSNEEIQQRNEIRKKSVYQTYH